MDGRKMQLRKALALARGKWVNGMLPRTVHRTIFSSRVETTVQIMAGHPWVSAEIASTL